MKKHIGKKCFLKNLLFNELKSNFINQFPLSNLPSLTFAIPLNALQQNIDPKERSIVSYKQILLIAIPIIISGLADTLNTAINTAFMGRIGEVQIDAVGLGGLFYYNWIVAAIGLSVGLQIVVGRRNGEGDFKAAGQALRNGLTMLFFLALLIFLVFYLFGDLIINRIIADPDIRSETNKYIHIRRYGLVFTFFCVCMRSFYIGITKTKIMTLVTIVTSSLNVFLDYTFIFGEFGFDPMGIEGAGYASLISEMVGFVIYLASFKLNPVLKKYEIFSSYSIHWEEIKLIFKTGSPLMLQYWASFASWFLFFLIIEKMGKTELAASNVIKNFYTIYLIPMWGFVSAANTLTSNFLGEKRPDKIPVMAKKTILLGTTAMILLVMPLLLFPEAIISLFTTIPSVIEKGIIPSRICITALIFFPTASVMLGVISGSGDTRFSLYIELSVIVVYVTFIILAGTVWHLEMYKIWYSEWLYVGIQMILSILRLRTGKWKSIEIEKA